jgi:hypothetical protein
MCIWRVHCYYLQIFSRLGLSEVSYVVVESSFLPYKSWLWPSQTPAVTSQPRYLPPAWLVGDVTTGVPLRIPHVDVWVIIWLGILHEEIYHPVASACRSLHINCSLLLFDFNQHFYVSANYSKKIPSARSQANSFSGLVLVHLDTQTDRQTWRIWWAFFCNC